jgi:RNase adaptor protein for sRNA GlmZ degradation
LFRTVVKSWRRENKMNNYKFRMSKLEMAMGCTAGYHKSLEVVNEPSEAADDGTGTHHLIDT